MNGDERGKRLVVLTGAGMSAESGLKTFRDAGGLWEEYDVNLASSDIQARHYSFCQHYCS